MLAGTIGTFANYGDDLMVSTILASMTTRYSAKIAFEKKGHSLVTPDIITELAETIS